MYYIYSYFIISIVVYISLYHQQFFLNYFKPMYQL